MKKLVVRANAKLNLTLDILGKRADGYHELSTVMQSVSLFDRLTVSRADQIEVHTSSVFIPDDRSNLCYRAAELFFQQTGLPGGVCVEVQKRIPVSAGLAGGSADAAAVLTALNRLCAAGLSERELSELGARLGADVPFCLKGGTALCQGAGERVTPLRPLPRCWVVIGRAGRKPSTAQLYAEYDRRCRPAPPKTPALLRALRAGDLTQVAARLGNAFEPVASTPHSAELARMLQSAGALGACLSGSGPAVFGLFDQKKTALAAAGRLREAQADAFCCHPVPRGCYFEPEPAAADSAEDDGACPEKPLSPKTGKLF